MRWKIASNDQCNFCKEEGYDHFFITCKYLKKFWEDKHKLLKNVKYETKIVLKHLVLGYKISDANYNDFNYFLTLLAFSIYKAYYVSEQKKK